MQKKKKNLTWCERKLCWEEETLAWLPELPALGDQDWNSLGLVFFFFFSHCRWEIGGRGERRRPQVTFWIISKMPEVNEWERKRGRDRRREERWGYVGVKGKGVKTGVMCSFPLGSAWWLQAVDFHRGLTLLHIALSLQSVWKLRPQREESEEGSVLTLYYTQRYTTSYEWVKNKTGTDC